MSGRLLRFLDLGWGMFQWGGPSLGLSHWGIHFIDFAAALTNTLLCRVLYFDLSTTGVLFSYMKYWESSSSLVDMFFEVFSVFWDS